MPASFEVRGQGTRINASALIFVTEIFWGSERDLCTEESGHRDWQGTHLFLKTDSGTIEIHVGPTDSIAGQQFPFATGDLVEVIGAKVKMQDQDALIAREITKAGKTVVLRNAQGIPNWSRGRRC